ncbi:MAG: DEAD-box ATP-dependent RNA helicase 17-like [Trebouxia sp. A1-2]|nr:MAG: DEAD-box ATP-dependent RNA helicase 17-like [Trebouxia sp. A1-2]
MDADDDLQLNLAGFEQPVSRPRAQARSNRHTVSFKKQQKKQKQAQREGRRHRVLSDLSSGADATKSALFGALKGYELTASKPQAPISSNTAEQHEQQKQLSQHTQAPTTSPSNVFPSRSQAGKKPAAPQVQQCRHEPSRKNDEVIKVAVSDIEAKREHIARKAKRDRAAFEDDDWEEVEHKSDEEEDDVMAAVAAMTKRDAQLQEQFPKAASHAADPAAAEEALGPSWSDDDDSDSPAGVVSFVPHSANKYPKQKKPRTASSTDQKPLAKAAQAPRTLLKAGELVHVATDVPLTAQQDMFGAVDSSTFQGLGLAPVLCEHLEAMNFTAPTRIQQATLPVLLAGRDALAKAPTGSGKTLAYLAAIIHDLQAQEPHLSRAEGTYAIIMAPTRELCIQICDVLTLILRRFIWLVGGSILGGEQRNKEKARLRKGITVVVASPGRLLDHLEKTTAFKTDELRWLVLDEADRLLDMGFQQKIGDIIAILDKRTDMSRNRRRQTVLLSATLHANLGKLATLSLTNPVSVGIRAEVVDGQVQVVGPSAAGQNADGSATQEPPQEDFEVPSQLRQQFIEVPGRMRLVALAAVLRSQCGLDKGPQGAKGVVFLSSCAGVDFHHALLGRVYEGIMEEPLLPCPLFRLHGSLEQAERTKTFLEFSRSASGVLLCTDVAARGLDFSGVYVHRVGRTARMGQQGRALLFLLPSEREYVDKLKGHGVQVQQGNLMQHITHLHKPSDGAPAQHKKGQPAEDHPAVVELQQQFMTAVNETPEVYRLAEDAFRSFTRAYAAHPSSVKDVFHVRKLHLGHVAHSFALRSNPTMIGQYSGGSGRKPKMPGAKRRR